MENPRTRSFTIMGSLRILCPTWESSSPHESGGHSAGLLQEIRSWDAMHGPTVFKSCIAGVSFYPGKNMPLSSVCYQPPLYFPGQRNLQMCLPFITGFEGAEKSVRAHICISRGPFAINRYQPSPSYALIHNIV